MALNFNSTIPHSHSWLLLFSLLCVFHTSLIPICHSQPASPQNIETFYPIEAPTPTLSPNSPTASPEQLGPPAAASKSSSSNSKIAKAVAATAAATLVVSGLIFFLVQRCLRSRRREEAVVPQSNNNGFERIEGNVRGLIVDENGLDVVYWRKLQGRNSSRGFKREIFRRSGKKKEHQEGKEGELEEEEDEAEGKKGKKSESVQEYPLLRGKSSTSHMNIAPEEDETNRITRKTSPPLPTIPASPIPERNSSAPPQSLPSITNRKSQAESPPPPPPIRTRKSPAAAPPPSMKSSSKPPSSSYGTLATTGKPGNSSGEGVSESSNGQVKLKPLYRDKANTTNADHKVAGGSFR